MWETFKLWWAELVDFLYRLVLTVFDFFRDFFYWVLDALISISMGFLNLVGTGFGALNPLQYISAIPPETQAMMQATGFNECMSIIVTAIGIRFLLQLVPFVRWGS